MTNEYRVADGIATISFTGDLLARADTSEPDKERWAEIAIYRTAAGKFVVAGVGRSCIAGEQDISWCKVLNDADGLVQALYRERNGDRFMPHINQRVLSAAAAIDPSIGQAFGLQHVA